MTQTSINSFLSGPSPSAPIAATRPLLMDGPDFSGISRLVMSQFSRPRELSISRCLRFCPGLLYPDLPDSNLDLRHVYPQRAVQIFPAFRDLKCLDFLVLENPDMPMAGLPMVTLGQLRTDPTADG
jgi:hypothetical protein